MNPKLKEIIQSRYNINIHGYYIEDNHINLMKSYNFNVIEYEDIENKEKLERDFKSNHTDLYYDADDYLDYYLSLYKADCIIRINESSNELNYCTLEIVHDNDKELFLYIDVDKQWYFVQISYDDEDGYIQTLIECEIPTLTKESFIGISNYPSLEPVLNKLLMRTIEEYCEETNQTDLLIL